jgi:flagellar motor component MotA
MGNYLTLKPAANALEYYKLKKHNMKEIVVAGYTETCLGYQN